MTPRLARAATLASLLLLLALRAPAAAPPQGGRPDPDAAATCGQCHPAFHDEWKGHGHASAWLDPIYQAELKTREKPAVCHACHVPQSVQAKLGKKPQARQAHLDEGVTCVACHKVGDVIHGPFGATTDAHPTEKNPAFSASGSTHLCASCHSTKIAPVLPVGRDHEVYREKLGERAKGCVDCHMPEVERHLAISLATGKPVGDKRRTRDHTILGPSNPEFLAKAFELSVRVEGKDVVVAVANQAGHRVPGLELRELPLVLAQLDGTGKEVGRHAVTFSADNPLDVLEARELRFALAGGAIAVQARLDHLFQGKKIATVLEQRLEWARGPASSEARQVLPARAGAGTLAVCAVEATAADQLSAKSCGECHVEFYEEWRERAHAHAWTNPIYQELTKTKTNPKSCHNCHIPTDVHEKLGKKPAVRGERLDEGVTCATCHHAQGKILGPFGATTDAHDSVKSSAFEPAGAIELCTSCHGATPDPVLPIHRDHAAYRAQAGAEAKACVECHMPRIERHLAIDKATGQPVGEKRQTRDHRVLGPRDVEFCAKAFELAARRDGADIVVSVKGMAGHRVPALKLRQFAFTVLQRDGDGKDLQTDRFALTHDNELKALETRELRYKAAAGATEVRVRVDHVFQEQKVATVLEAGFPL